MGRARVNLGREGKRQERGGEGRAEERWEVSRVVLALTLNGWKALRV